jgi:hypothetical protein
MAMKTRRILLAFFFCSFPVVVLGCAHSKKVGTELISCYEHPDQHASSSVELQNLVDADQADRQGSVDKIDWTRVLPRDLERRARVSEIFAEGCLKEAKDYSAAAMVYQHGETADHSYQTFIWAKRAVELGDSSQNWIATWYVQDKSNFSQLSTAKTLEIPAGVSNLSRRHFRIPKESSGQSSASNNR